MPDSVDPVAKHPAGAAHGGPPEESGDNTRTMELQSAIRTEPAAERLAKGTRIGRFIVLDALGEGGMGVVYAGLDVELERRVALKFLHARAPVASGSDTPRASSRLLREAQALAKLSHPNVVAVYDVGAFGDQVFIAMELVEGQSLGEWMREAPRGWPEVIEVFSAAGRGLTAAHNAGLVHRDFKPSNVLFRRDGRVAVMDFGLARRSGTRVANEAEGTGHRAPSVSPTESPLMTHQGIISGTPSYMAPEVFKGAQADTAADQFAFCVALYEGFFGTRPFPNVKPDDPARWVAKSPPENTDVPESVCRVVMRGLSVDPASRFPSMDALLDELQREPSRRARNKVQRRNLLVLCGVILLGLPLDWLMSGVFRLEPFTVRATWGLAVGVMGLLVGAGKLSITRAAIVIGAISPVAVGLLCLDTGGSNSPFFRTFLMLPLFAVVVGPDNRGAVISTLVFSYVSAIALQIVTGDAWTSSLLTTVAFVGLGALCLHGVRHHRQLREAERMADRGRIDALERLAAYERARAAEEMKRGPPSEASSSASQHPQ